MVVVSEPEELRPHVARHIINRRYMLHCLVQGLTRLLPLISAVADGGVLVAHGLVVEASLDVASNCQVAGLPVGLPKHVL